MALVAAPKMEHFCIEFDWASGGLNPPNSIRGSVVF
jgi:hypothetical protein